MSDSIFNIFNITYVITVLLIIAGFLLIIFNKRLMPEETRSSNLDERFKNPQIPSIGMTLMVIGDIVLVALLIISKKLN